MDLPASEPGQIRIVELDATGLDRLRAAVLSGTDVVLYESAIAALLGQILPPGIYAEPLRAAGPAGLARAMRLAGDGWRVLLLVESGGAWPEHALPGADLTNAAVREGEAPGIVFAVPGFVTPAQARVFTANGLAG